ncbi:MAG: DUF4158 domain-containing protein [Acidimicrobiales bacterium]
MRTRSDHHLLALAVTLKCFQRLGYFPAREEVPPSVVDHVRRCLDLPEGTLPMAGARTAKAHRELVRSRSGVTHDPQRARAVAAEAIRSAAASKNNPADLINVALEMLVKASLELPAYSTLDEMASRIRREVNTAIFDGVVARMPLPDRVRLEGLLDVAGPGAKSDFSRLTAPAGRASWSEFRDQVARLRWVDSLGDTERWLEGVAESKVADFAGEAAAADAGVMRDVASLKRTALLACLVHSARGKARDELAELFCKRMASITKRARNELEEIRQHHAEMSDRLIANYRSVLGHLDPRNEAEEAEALRRARLAVREAGGFEAQLADIEAVAAHLANHHMPLVAKQWRKDRATMFAFVRAAELEPTSADRSVLDAVAHALAHSHMTRDFIPDHVEGRALDLSFASEPWLRLLRDRDRPGRLNRRHFEACVFTYLWEELRTGDVAVRGSEAYANRSAPATPSPTGSRATCTSGFTPPVAPRSSRTGAASRPRAPWPP